MSTDGAAVIPVSVVVMTRNEESNIGKCLDALTAFDEIFVVDSESSDATPQIAESKGAKVVEFVWNGQYPKKKQWGIDNLPFRNEWLLYVDADEIVTPELVEEIREVMRRGPNKAGYFIGLDHVFMDKRMTHGQRVWKLLLHHRDKVYYAPRPDLDTTMGEIEGIYNPKLDGESGTLKGAIIHDDHKSLFHYFERHNRYSDFEAKTRSEGEFIRADDTQMPIRGLLKRAFDKLPFKPILAFIYCYVVKAGFLDGKDGFNYALSKAFYYWQVEVKSQEYTMRKGQSASSMSTSTPKTLLEQKEVVSTAR